MKKLLAAYTIVILELTLAAVGFILIKEGLFSVKINSSQVVISKKDTGISEPSREDSTPIATLDSSVLPTETQSKSEEKPVDPAVSLPQETTASKVTTPNFDKKSVVVKFASGTVPISTTYDSHILDKSSISYMELDKNTVPSVISTLNTKYHIVEVEKVFKGAGTPNEEVTSLYKKFSEEILEGKRHINEAELLKIDLSTVYKFTFADDVPVEQIIAELKSDPSIVYAEPDYFLTEELTPNDPRFSEQWGPQKIQAPTCWDINTGSSDIIVAIIDSGADYNHEDLASHIWINTDEIAGNGIDDDGNGYIDDWHGWDFRNSDNDPIDDRGHGTHVAGIVSAVGNNSLGVAGTSWNSKLMIIKYLSATGTGGDASASIYYAVDNGAKIINMSWGSTGNTALLRDAVNFAYNAGLFLNAAAGNNNVNTRFYPAAYGNVMGVAATDENDLKASFSNYGSWIDVSAPGVSILATYLNNNYAYGTGTSAASPFVSGLAALMWSQNPYLTNAQVFSIISANTNPLVPQDYDGDGNIDADDGMGTGRINNYLTMTFVDSLPIVDLSTSISESSDPVYINDNLIYTVVVSNAGPDNAPNVTLSDTLPSGVNFVSASSGSGSCTEGSGIVTCTFASIPASGSVSIVITVETTVASELSNNATVSVSGYTTDTNGSNNSSTITTSVIDTMYVSSLGSDSGNGKVDSPFKSITRALQGIKPGMTVVLRSNNSDNYSDSTANGGTGVEQFPIVISPNVHLNGEVSVIGGQTVLPRIIQTNLSPCDTGLGYYHYCYVIVADNAQNAIIENIEVHGFDGVRMAEWWMDGVYGPIDNSAVTLKNSIIRVLNNAVYTHSWTHPTITNNKMFTGYDPVYFGPGSGYEGNTYDLSLIPGNYEVTAWGNSTPTVTYNVFTVVIDESRVDKCYSQRESAIINTGGNSNQFWNDQSVLENCPLPSGAVMSLSPNTLDLEINEKGILPSPRQQSILRTVLPALKKS